MIVEYHRPQSLEDALILLARPEPPTLPMGGGASLNKPSSKEIAVVDLQDLGLDDYRKRGNFLDLGATLTLEVLFQRLDVLPDLKEAIRHEANRNLRQVATIAGTLISARGRSPFTTACLALEATLSVVPGVSNGNGKPLEPEILSLGDVLPLREERLRGRVVTLITLPLNARLAFRYVARSPADKPIVCAAAVAWPSGRVRVSLGGYGGAPVLAFDGPEQEGAETAARNAYSQAGDKWASAAYREDVAGVLTARCLKDLELA